MVVILVALFVGCVVAQGNCSSVECFDDEREKLVSLDLQALVGGNMTDTSLESQVEAVMFQHRFDLSQKFFDPPLPQRNWREIEDIAKATPLYQMLKTMPKGLEEQNQTNGIFLKTRMKGLFCMPTTLPR
jgi:hypothetical protein